MADIKISELGAASAVNSTDIFPMTSSGVTVKATAQQIKNYMGVGNITDLNTTEKSSTVAAINEVNTKVSKTEDLIAYIQTSLTASKAYTVGEQFIYNGLLYKATSAIAQGGTITINGNCALADSVTEQINAIWAVTADTSIPDVTAIKVGRICNIRVSHKITSAPATSGWINLGTLPQSYRPAVARVEVAGIDNISSTDTYQVRIHNQGVVYVWGVAGKTPEIVANVTYVTNS